MRKKCKKSTKSKKIKDESWSKKIRQRNGKKKSEFLSKTKASSSKKGK